MGPEDSIIENILICNNEKLWGNYWSKKEIKSPQILKQEKEYILIIICAPLYEYAIRKEIENMKISCEVKSMHEFTMDAFGQYGEDVIVEKIFGQMQIPMNKISYIEIGIPEPIRGSNTYRFYKMGNKGCCVEANLKKLLRCR